MKQFVRGSLVHKQAHLLIKKVIVAANKIPTNQGSANYGSRTNHTAVSLKWVLRILMVEKIKIVIFHDTLKLHEIQLSVYIKNILLLHNHSYPFIPMAAFLLQGQSLVLLTLTVCPSSQK